jgi:type IV pilus assembly protein PilC
MPKYQYSARDQQDRVVSGAVDGNSVEEVADRLSEKNLIPIAIDELNFDGSKKNLTFFEKLNASLTANVKAKVPLKAVVFFTRQLATMLNAGVPLAQALTQLAANEGPTFKKVILQVSDDISMGSTFSDAIRKHPGAFNGMYVAVVQSGEIAGALDKVLDELATYSENTEAMRAKVKGAMRYPTFIGGFVTILIIGILWKLVPTFQTMYSSMNVALPLPTQILVSVSNVIQHNFLIVMGLLVMLVIGFYVAQTFDAFKRFMDRAVLYAPVFGMILKKNIWAKFCRTMALLLEAGTPILQAIEIGGAVVGNKVYSEALEKVYKKLQTGDMLSQALKDTGEFPVLVTQLAATGEEAGKVDELLRKAAEFFEREIKVTVESIASIIEPIMIIGLGAIVGGIIVALYLPIFSLGQMMK